jgi:hypothetical protein
LSQPDKELVDKLCARVFAEDANLALSGYVSSKVYFGQKETTNLHNKLYQDILSLFPLLYFVPFLMFYLDRV